MNLIGAIDIGSNTTKAILGGLKEEAVTLAGVGKSDTEGVRNGKIFHPGKTGESLKEAVGRAREMASEDPDSLFLGVSGNLINFSVKKATVSITSRDRIVKKEDLKRLKDMVSSDIPGIHESPIAVIPRDFILDGQKGSTDPLGLEARRLDLVATLATIDEKSRRNFSKTVSRADLKEADILPAPVCLGHLLLSEEKLKRGRIIVDFGMETTDLSVFKGGALQFHKTRQLGGKNLTGDIAAKLNIPREEARKIKHETDLSEYKKERKTLASASEKAKKAEEKDDRDSVEALSARLEEIFELLLSDIYDRGFGDLTRYGIHVTGGSSKLTGLTDFLNENFEERFQPGSPDQDIRGIIDVIENPVYSNALGLLTCTTKGQFKDQRGGFTEKSREKSLSSRVLTKLKNLFESRIFLCL